MVMKGADWSPFLLDSHTNHIYYSVEDDEQALTLPKVGPARTGLHVLLRWAGDKRFTLAGPPLCHATTLLPPPPWRVQDWDVLYRVAGIRSFMAVPIGGIGEVLGLLTIAKHEPGAFKDEW